MILGSFGPIQMIVLLVIPIGLIIGLILLISSRAKHKGRAEAMKEMLDRKERSKEQKENK
jgi:hypothetical protein